VVGRSFASPGGASNRLTQSYWQQHQALDLVSNGWVYPSAPGTAYLVKDTTWRSWCPSWIKSGRYDGPAYGIYIDHANGIRTVYWHIQP